MLTGLVKDPVIGKRVVPIVPGRVADLRHGGAVPPARHLLAGSASSTSPRTRDQLMFYKEDKNGQILQEGINEAGATCSWIAAGTSYANSDVPMIPFYIFYSMFGMQRVGDLIWAAGDLRARGFLLGATVGAHHAERRGAAARGRPQPRPGRHRPQLRRLRPDVRLRGGGHHPGRPAPHGRRSRRTSSITSPS